MGNNVVLLIVCGIFTTARHGASRCHYINPTRQVLSPFQTKACQCLPGLEFTLSTF